MESNRLFNLSPQQLRRAAEIKESIEELSAGLAELFGEGNTSLSKATKGAKGEGKKRKMSLEARRKIADAQKARWAKVNGAKGKSDSKPAKVAGSEKRRTMSPEAKAKIAAAAKARWAKAKAAKETKE
jgi:hypothetical protein